MNKPLVTDAYASVLAVLRRRDGPEGVPATEIRDELELGTAVHPVCNRMKDRGWIEVAQRDANTVSYRITKLGRAALSYALAERRTA